CVIEPQLLEVALTEAGYSLDSDAGKNPNIWGRSSHQSRSPPSKLRRSQSPVRVWKEHPPASRRERLPHIDRNERGSPVMRASDGTILKNCYTPDSPHGGLALSMVLEKRGKENTKSGPQDEDVTMKAVEKSNAQDDFVDLDLIK
ncbi:hypothetical protein C0993_010975, partial [Termitomyces sp. T159_Od127]